MARIRTIKPEMWNDDKFIDLSSDTVRLFFIGLLNHVNDWGRAHYSPREVRRRIYPDRVELDVAPIFEELSKVGLVILYSVGGKQYFAIRNFSKHQKIDRKTPSDIPAPPTSDQEEPLLDESSMSARRVLDERSMSARRAIDEPSTSLQQIEATTNRILDEHSSTEGKGTERNGKGGEGEGINRAPSQRLNSDADPDFVPDELDVYQYAKGLLELIRLPATRALQELARSSIETFAKAEGMDHARATEIIRDRAIAAKNSGVVLDRFWFEDGSFNYEEGRKPDAQQQRKSKFAAESDELRRRLSESVQGSMAD